MTVAVPLPTATFWVHEVSGLEEVEETREAGAAPEMLVASVAVPARPLNALPRKLTVCAEQSSLIATVPETFFSRVVKIWSPAAHRFSEAKKVGVSTPATLGLVCCWMVTSAS